MGGIPFCLQRQAEVSRPVRLSFPFGLARLEGLEPPTRCLEGSCSVHLSYRRVSKLPAGEENRGDRIRTDDLLLPRQAR
jgi:hypothetical protein